MYKNFFLFKKNIAYKCCKSSFASKRIDFIKSLLKPCGIIQLHTCCFKQMCTYIEWNTNFLYHWSDDRAPSRYVYNKLHSTLLYKAFFVLRIFPTHILSLYNNIQTILNPQPRIFYIPYVYILILRTFLIYSILCVCVMHRKGRLHRTAQVWQRQTYVVYRRRQRYGVKHQTHIIIIYAAHILCIHVPT